MSTLWELQSRDKRIVLWVNRSFIPRNIKNVAIISKVYLALNYYTYCFFIVLHSELVGISYCLNFVIKYCFIFPFYKMDEYIRWFRIPRLNDIVVNSNNFGQFLTTETAPFNEFITTFAAFIKILMNCIFSSRTT